MRPVHVIITADPREADAWGASFGGGIELYRFASNTEAFERLIGATSPIHLLVVTQSQDTMFNLKTDELVRRLAYSPVGSVPALSNLGIVVVGQHAQEGPRVVACRTLEAAARFVTYGEREPLEQAATLTPMAPATAEQEPPPSRFEQLAEVIDTGQSVRRQLSRDDDGPNDSFIDSLIDSVWRGGGPTSSQMQAPARAHQGEASPAASAEPMHGQAPPHREPATNLGRVRMPRTAARVQGGGPAPQQRSLFTQASRTQQSSAHDARGGRPAHLDAGPTEEIHDEPLLEPARQILLERRGYQSDGTRGLSPTARQVVAGARSAPIPGQVPVPSSSTPPVVPGVPAVTGQVAQLVYGGQAQTDPMLGWSAKVQEQLAAQNAMPQPAPVTAGQVAYAQAPQHASQNVIYSQTPTVPVAPYSQPQQQAPQYAQPQQLPQAPQPTQARNEVFSAPTALLDRGEQDGVSFG